MPWLGIAALVVPWALGLASYVVGAVVSPEFAPALEAGWRLTYLAYPTAGAVILVRRARHPIGLLLFGVGVASQVAGLAQAYATVALLRPGEPTTLALAAGWLGSWPWYPALGSILTFLFLLFPDGCLPSRRWRPVAWASAAVLTYVTAWAAFAPRPVEIMVGPEATAPPNPLGIEGPVGSLLSAFEPIALPALGVLAALCGASIVIRYRAADLVARQQLKWVVVGGVAALGSFVVREVGRLLGLDTTAADWIFMAGFIAPPITIVLAVLRHRLYDVDRVLRRTTVYALLTTLLVGFYLLGVTALGALLEPLQSDSPIAVATATLSAAAVAAPLRRRLQASVDRRFDRARYDAAREVDGFRTSVRDEVDLDALTASLVATVGATVRPSSAGVWLRDAVPQTAPGLPPGAPPVTSDGRWMLP